MDLYTGLWIAWVLAFAVLEGIALRDPHDRAWTLTNRIRLLMRSSPVARWFVRAGIGFGLTWLAYHFLAVDPTLHPGAWHLA
jgi:hypothetical protein